MNSRLDQRCAGPAEPLTGESLCHVLQDRIRWLSEHDELTGLYNRHYLEEAVKTAILDAQTGGGHCALLHIDIDRFRLIRNYAGLAACDRLLNEIADAMRQICGARHCLVRVEGDQFAALLKDVSMSAAIEIGQALRQTLARVGFVSGANRYTVRASIGIAAIDAGSTGGHEQIMREAHQASFVAKQRGGNMVHCYNREDAELADQQKVSHWAPLIRAALADGRFRLVFQPVLRIADMTIDHFEVLVRMVGEDGALLSPQAFIPVAEQVGMIHDIDRWVVGAAIDVLRDTAGDLPDIAFNVNLSGRAFEDELLLPTIEERLFASGVNASRITFEITETAAIGNFEQTRAMVDKLRALGCRFALDDFGAGFASYSYLKEFPFDFLKIDGAFITNVARDSTDQVLVKSMVDVAHTLGKQTTAEFVGDRETLSLLGRYGVDHAQGFFIGRPDPAIRRELPPALTAW
jgi:diguanylate cyclase (GGDEF)-like protein